MFPTLPLSYLSVFLLMSSQVACAANPTIDTDDTSIQNTPKSQSLTLSEANRGVNNEADDIEIIDPLTDLKNNQRKWQKSGIVSYDYEYIHQCLDCAPVKTHYMALTVKQNQLDPIYDQRTQAPLKSTQKGSLLIHTINDWFYLIEEKIQKNTDAFFSVEYYPISGQPRQLFLTDQQAKKSHYFFRAAIPLKVDYASTSINANHNNKAID
ncbi:MAG TPA: hypothetical protein ENK78_02155 [Thiothrix sp.]|nr:hypothetical protein [Thiothrix sp.]